MGDDADFRLWPIPAYGRFPLMVHSHLGQQETTKARQELLDEMHKNIQHLQAENARVRIALQDPVGMERHSQQTEEWLM